MGIEREHIVRRGIRILSFASGRISSSNPLKQKGKLLAHVIKMLECIWLLVWVQGSSDF